MPARSLTFMTSSLRNLFWKIVLSVLVLSWGSAYAQDQYDGQNGQLTIPLVKAFGNTYRDVVIQVGDIVAVNSGVALDIFDSYDSFTNQLTIPSVMAYGKKYTNVVVSVQAVLSVGAQLDADKWSLTEIIDAGEIDMSIYAPMAYMQNGHYELLAAGDLNGDGHDDLLITPKVWNVFTPYVKLVVAFYNDKTRKFEVNPDLQNRMPSMQWGQKAVIADFNNDGYKDFLVVGTGPDQGQPCGEASILMLGSKNGLIDASENLPRVSGYTHQMAFGDFNSDGKTDFVILNNQWVPWSSQDPRITECSYRKFPGTGKSYLVLSNSSGWTAKDLEIGSEFGPIVKNYDSLSYSSAFAADFDGDGKIDLVISGGNFGALAYKNIFLKGDGLGGLSYHSQISAKPFGDATVSIGITGKDFDDDGNPELVLNFAKHPGVPSSPFQGSIYQVFKADYLKKTWTDVTSLYFPTDYNAADADLTFCDSIDWFDINHDGYDDMICRIMSEFPNEDPALLNPRIWLKLPKGKKISGRAFIPAFHTNISIKYKMADMLPVKIDGKKYVVGVHDRGANQIIKIQLAR